MIILIDQDGVLANFNERLYEIWRDEAPATFAEFRVPLNDLRKHDTLKHYPPWIRDHLEEITHRPGFFESLPVIPGAVEAMHELLASVHQICICTRPMGVTIDQCTAEKFRWVRRHLGEAFVERTMVVRDKTFAYGDILIDDKPKVTGKNKPSWQHVLYDQPYNRRGNKRRITWTGDWREVLGI